MDSTNIVASITIETPGTYAVGCSCGWMKYPIAEDYTPNVFEMKLMKYSNDILRSTLNSDRYNMVFGTYERHSAFGFIGVAANDQIKMSISSSVNKSGTTRAVYVSPFIFAIRIIP